MTVKTVASAEDTAVHPATINQRTTSHLLETYPTTLRNQPRKLRTDQASVAHSSRSCRRQERLSSFPQAFEGLLRRRYKEDRSQGPCYQARLRDFLATHECQKVDPDSSYQCVVLSLWQPSTHSRCYNPRIWNNISTACLRWGTDQAYMIYSPLVFAISRGPLAWLLT